MSGKQLLKVLAPNFSQTDGKAGSGPGSRPGLQDLSEFSSEFSGQSPRGPRRTVLRALSLGA